MAENPEAQNPEAQETPEEAGIKRNRSIIKAVLGSSVAAVVLSVILGMLAAGSNTRPNKWTAVEDAFRKEYNAKIKDGQMSKSGIKYPPNVKFKDGKWVIVDFSGPNNHGELVRAKDGPGIKKPDKDDIQPPQRVRMPAHCVDYAWGLNQCVRRLFKTDLRWNSAGRLPARQDAISSEVKAETYGPHVRGECVFDVSVLDAYGRLPVEVDENGDLVYFDELPNKTKADKERIAQIRREVRATVRGMHVIAVEHCGQEVGLTGALCPGSVWRDTIHLKPGDPGECSPDDKWYQDMRVSLLADPPEFGEMDISDILWQQTVDLYMKYLRDLGSIENLIEIEAKLRQGGKKAREAMEEVTKAGGEKVEQILDWVTGKGKVKKPQQAKRPKTVEEFKNKIDNNPGLIIKIINNPNVLKHHLSPNDACQELIDLIKEIKREPWAKNGIRKLKKDAKQDRFTRKGFTDKYFPDMPFGTKFTFGRIFLNLN